MGGCEGPFRVHWGHWVPNGVSVGSVGRCWGLLGTMGGTLGSLGALGSQWGLCGGSRDPNGGKVLSMGRYWGGSLGSYGSHCGELTPRQCHVTVCHVTRLPADPAAAVGLHRPIGPRGGDAALPAGPAGGRGSARGGGASSEGEAWPNVAPPPSGGGPAADWLRGRHGVEGGACAGAAEGGGGA